MLFEPTLKLSGLLAKQQTNLKQHIAPTLNWRQTSATHTHTIYKPTLNRPGITNPTHDTDTLNQPQAHTTAAPNNISSWTDPRLLLAPKVSDSGQNKSF